MQRVISFPKSRDMLVRVKESGIRIALATSSDGEDLATYGRIVNMDDLIEKVSSSADARESKPEPDIFAVALMKMGVCAEQAIALGDTPYDAEAARKLGITVIGLTCRGWKRNDLRDAGCVEVYQDPADLLLHFDSLALAR